MRQQAVKQAGEKNNMDVALAALGKSIARWTDKESAHDRDPGRVTVSAGRTDSADELHARAEHLRDRPRGQTRAARRRHICVRRAPFFAHLRGSPHGGADSPREPGAAVPESPRATGSARDGPADGRQPSASAACATPSRGMATGAVTVPLLSACQRLLDLLAAPQDIPILAPLIQREILYRLLVGEQGARLRQIASAGSPSQQIAQAIAWLKRHYTLPLRIEDLAAHVHMSPSTFHHHFRALTAMSPLQYQKWLRLHEARRLMLTERLDATTAAFEVGYESPSQFSREYRRVFGAPPLRDITSLRHMAG